MLKRLFSHTLIYGLAPQIPKIAGILALPIITAHVTKLDYGVFGVISAISGSIAVLGNLGLNVVLVNSFYKNPGLFGWAWRQIYGFLILWNFPYAILLSAVLYFFIPQEAHNNAKWIILLNVLPIVAFGPTSVLGATYFQLKMQPMKIAIRAVIVGFLTVLLNIYFIAYLHLGYMGWFISVAISQILLQCSYWYPLVYQFGIIPIFNFKRKFIKKQLIISLPTIPHYYAGYLLDTSDRFVMKIVSVPTGDIGLYNAANTVSNLISMLGIAAGKASVPILTKSYKENDEIVARRVIYTLQISFFMITFSLSIWMKEIFHFLIRNESLRLVYPLGVILTMAYNYRPMYFGANARLFFHEKTGMLMRITFIAGLTNLILNFIFIPIYGYQVAAYTTFIALMYMGYSGYFLKEFKLNCTVNYYPIYWLCSTILLTLLAWLTVDYSNLVKVIVNSLVLLVGLFSLNFVNGKKLMIDN